MVMDEQRRNAILAKAYGFLETQSEPHVSPPQTWQPRQAEEPESAPQRKQSPIADVVNLRNHLAALEARHKADRAAISSCLDAIAEEAGAATGQLQKQIGELKEQLEQLRGELALARAQANVPARKPKDAASRAPFKISGEIGNVRN